MSAPQEETARQGRPDPFNVPRRPMAKAGRGMVFSAQRSTDAEGDAKGELFTDLGVDVNRWYALVDDADVVLEGAIDGVQFDGSASMHITLSAADIGSVLGVLPIDARLERVITDRLRRELAALLGPRTPHEPQLIIRAREAADQLRIDAEIEGEVENAVGSEHPAAQ